MTQLRVKDPVRAKRWEHFTKKKSGEYYPEFKDMYYRYALETVLDNNARANHAAGQQLFETSTTTDPGVAAFNRFAFPLIRRIYSQVVGRELVSIQPMSGPTTMIFYIDHYRNDTTPATGLQVRGEYASGKQSREYADEIAQGSAEAANIVREIDVGITSTSVTATSKKIKTKYSWELAQDMRAIHGLSAEGELVGTLAEEIAKEIDETIIYDLVNGAGAGNINWTAAPTSVLPTEIRAYKETLWEAIIDARNLIFSAIYKDPTFIIGDVASIARLEKMEGFEYVKFADAGGGELGRIRRIGTYKGQYKVYKDPGFPVANTLLLGFKGSEWLRTGYVYAPYIPFVATNSFTNPDTLTVLRGAMSRQAFKMLNSSCYATVTIVAS
jgi:hypothetical protein